MDNFSFVSPRDVSSVENLIRKGRDILIVGPHLSGLSTYLKQIEERIQISNNLKQYQVVIVNKNSVDLNSENLLASDSKDEVFVSYAWGGESERTVDAVEHSLTKYGIHIIRDKKDLGYKGSIEEFEQRIGQGQCIILIISDKYLRSEHCMHELVEIGKNQEFRKRIFPIVLEDAHIYKPIDRLKYIKYWDEQIENLNQSIKEVGVMINLTGITANLDKYARIRANFEHLTDLLSDMNALTPEIHATSGFSSLINAISLALTGNPPKQEIDSDNSIQKSVIEFITNKLNIDTSAFSSDGLSDFFSTLLIKRPDFRSVIIVDNIQSFDADESRNFLENVRVLSELRQRNKKLEQIVFIIAGHELDLKKLSSERNSVFNVADRILIDDFPENISVEIIKEMLDRSSCMYSSLIPSYIDYLCFGHPYLINRISNYLASAENSRGGKSRKISFKIIDQLVEKFCEDGFDHVFKELDNSLSKLSAPALETLNKLFLGYRYDADKTFPQIEELRLFGVISNSRNSVWHIRNEIYATYLRQKKDFLKACIKPIPRRLFANAIGYQVVFTLENDIRDFVLSKLTGAYSDKWESHVDSNLLAKWNAMKDNEVKSGWSAGEEFPSITYSLFPELRKIIEDENNWKVIFHNYFKPRDVFVGYFANLEALRNKIAHNRPLSDIDIDRLNEISNAFQNCMYD